MAFQVLVDVCYQYSTYVDALLYDYMQVHLFPAGMEWTVLRECGTVGDGDWRLITITLST